MNKPPNLPTLLGNFLCLFLLVALPAPIYAAEHAAPQSSPVLTQRLTLQQYISELDRTKSLLDDANPQAALKYLPTLAQEWIVEDAGQAYHIKLDWLRAALEMQKNGGQKKNALIDQAKFHLTSLREAAVALQSQPAGADQLRRSRAALDRILDAREFRGARGPSYYEILRTRALGWIQRQMAKIFGHVRRSAAISGAIAWGLIAIVSLLLAYWAVRASIGARVEIDWKGSAPASRGWRDWLRDARVASEAGDFRTAIHAAYWASVARLVELQLLPEDRSRTPRESLRLLQSGSQAHAPLARLTSRLELVWYGCFPATASDWNEAAKQLETLECLAPSTPKTPGC